MPLYTDEMDMETGAAHKGDAGLHVEFYERTVREPANPDIGRIKDEERQVVYCRIIVPGDKNFVHDQPARQQDKERFPRHWLAFNMTRDNSGQVYGTPLKQWNVDDPSGFNDNQLIELVAMRFQTVEQIAGANDMQLQRMGLGAEGLKIRAKAYLDGKNRSRESSELAETKQALADLQRQMADFMAANRSPATVGASTDNVMTPAQERMAKARAARKVNAGGEQHASATGAASHG